MKLLLTLMLLTMPALNSFAQDNQIVLHFDLNKADVSGQDAASLIKKMYASNSDSITIIGHCDSIGDINYNVNLSRRRASAVKKLLVQNGFKKEAIKLCEGKGETQLINKGSSDEALQANRRVEIYFNKKAIINEEKPILATSMEASKNAISKQPKLTATQKKIAAFQFKVGDKLVLENVQFYGSSHTLLPESVPVILQLIEALKQKPEIHLAIQGHVCCVTPDINGDDAFDMETRTPDLSLKRAEAIYKILVKNGINKERLTFKGFGANQKLFPQEANEEQKIMNRRVEFMVTKN
jgi:outer membrane protein OmpA-like peptidoglycan-associated protein